MQENNKSKMKAKNKKNEYDIIPIFNPNGEKVEIAIQNAFMKFLKYNDYK